MVESLYPRRLWKEVHILTRSYLKVSYDYVS